MKADLKGALWRVNQIWHLFEHKGKSMTKAEVIKALNYGIKKGYKDTSELTDEDIETAIKQN